MPVGAVGAVLAVNSRPAATSISKADVKRALAEAAGEKHRQRFQAIMQRYDTDRTGKLSRGQLEKLLTDIDGSTPEGTAPTDDELQWVLKVADYKGTVWETADGQIDLDEIEDALTAWQTYMENREDLEATFAKYDIGGLSGQLDKDELKSYLTSLNGDIPVSDAEVQWVLKTSDLTGNGALNKPELMRATAQWYAHVQSGKPAPASACCILQ